MEVLRNITPNKNLVIALGYFDGIHLGHKKVISTIVRLARLKDLKSAVVTFDKNPADYFSSEQTLGIQTFKDRELILDSMGVDYLYELNFEEYMNYSADVYLRNVLIENLKPKIIVAGYNHTFGKDRAGNPEFLKKNADKLGYECIIIPEYKYHNDSTVSSSEIRKRIQYGELNSVEELLGRRFYVRNSVIKGNRIARTLGYPTANLIWPSSMVKLPYGVYFGFAQLETKLRPALISWGVRPTLTDGKSEVLEAHIYNLNENLYGRIIKVIFDKKLRDEQHFGNFNLLLQQLHKDYEEFQKWAMILH